MNPEAIEAAARAMAILDDHDGCFLEVNQWEGQEDWEREAHPDNYPGMAYEDCEYWRGKSRAALEAAAPYLVREARADASEEALRAAIEQMKLYEKWFADDVLKGYREGRYKVQHILGELQSARWLRQHSAAIRDGRA